MATPSSPIFSSLPGQLAAALRLRIAAGTWAGKLPAERPLAAEFHVSRKTVRKALAQLRRAGELRPPSARGHLIARRARTAAPGTRDVQVAFLSPVPLAQMRPFTVLWLDRLRSLLAERRGQLRLVSGGHYFSRQANGHLARLVAGQPADCWLLAGSSAVVQRWFQSSAAPCVLAGSCHVGIDLPNVDLDHAALGQHAAGVLLAAGHRRITMLMEEAALAGDTKTRAGFERALVATREHEVEFAVAPHPSSPAGIHRVVQRLLQRSAAPTALFVSRSADYLSVLSSLGGLRLRIGEDISLLLRHDEPFLNALFPTPNRYAFSPDEFASRMDRLVASVLTGELTGQRHVSVLPTYVPGKSVCRLAR